MGALKQDYSMRAVKWIPVKMLWNHWHLLEILWSNYEQSNSKKHILENEPLKNWNRMWIQLRNNANNKSISRNFTSQTFHTLGSLIFPENIACKELKFYGLLTIENFHCFRVINLYSKTSLQLIRNHGNKNHIFSKTFLKIKYTFDCINKLFYSHTQIPYLIITDDL